MSGFFQRAKDFPPILCRLLARHKRGRPLTTVELAQTCNTSPHVIESLSWATSWKGVDLPTMQAFTLACGVDLERARSMGRAYTYLRKKPSFKYLRTDPQWKTYFLPMLGQWCRTSNPEWAPLRALVQRLEPLTHVRTTANTA